MKPLLTTLVGALFVGVLLVLPLSALADPPTITQQPTNQAVMIGSNATFLVAATGTLPLSYQWRSSCGSLTDSTNSTLVLTAVTTNQSGCAYWAEVTNVDGSITSQVAILTVARSSTPDALNPGPNGIVYCTAVQPDGKILAGGDFTALCGQSCTNLARLNADGTLDAVFKTGADSPVFSLVLQPDGKILVGGFFVTLGGQSRSYLGRLNADGTLDATFNPKANGTVRSIAVQADGMILVGGGFTMLGKQYRQGVGRLYPDGTVDASFTFGGSDNFVYSLALQQDGKILVGGCFRVLSGQYDYPYLGRLNSDGSLDTAFLTGANDYVYALAVRPDRKILVGGRFTTLGGQSRSCLGCLDADGMLDATFNSKANGSVYTIAVQADGRMLVGGAFTMLGEQSRPYLGRVNADGTPDATFNPGTDSSVCSLAIQADGRILVGGYFSTLGGQNRSYLGRLIPAEPATEALAFDGSTVTWQRDGSSPEAWRTVFEGSPDGTNWLALGPGTRIPGGWQLNGLSWPSKATLRARGFVTGGYQSGSSWFVETSIGPPVFTTQPASQTVLLGSSGSFSASAVGASPLSYSWFLNGVLIPDATNSWYNANDPPLSASGSQFSCLASNAFGSTTSLVAVLSVRALPPTITQEPVSQTILVGSNATFRVLAEGTSPLLYQWRSSSGALVDCTNSILSLPGMTTNQSGCTYWVEVTNAFGAVTSAPAMLRVLCPSTPDAFNPGANGMVYGMAVQPDGKILVGGDFTSLGGQSRPYLGRLYSDGTLDTDFDPGAYGAVYSFALQADGRIIVGGNFAALGIQSRGNLCRLNPDGTWDASFDAQANGPVHPVAIQPDGKILVGGNFSTLGGQFLSCLGRLNSDGTLDTNFNPLVGGAGGVYSLALQPDGKILVGGYFTSLGGQSRSNIGRLNADGSLDTTFNPGANFIVYALAVQPDGKILVAGAFTILGGRNRYYIGRINADGSLDTGFNPGASVYPCSLVLQADGKVLVGGYFTTLAGQYCPYSGRLNADGTLDATFTAWAGKYVFSLAVQADGEILVGGYFTTLGDQNRSYIGRLTPTEPVTQALVFDGSTATWQRGGSSPEVSRTVFEGSTNSTSWVALGGGVRVPGGWQLSGLSWPTNALLRARGFVAGGYYNGSGWFVETNFTLASITTQPTNQDLTPVFPPGTFTHFSDGQFQFTLAGKQGASYEVQVSTNLIDWNSLTVVTLTNSAAILLDTNTDSRQRFYRAKSVP